MATLDSPTLSPTSSALRRPLVEAGILLAVSVAAAAVLWTARPGRIPLVVDPAFYELELAAPLVEVQEAIGLFDEGEHIFVDVRSIEPGAAPTILGAFPLRPDTFDDDLLALFDILYPEDPVILFDDGDLSAASNIATRLTTRGYEDLLILNSGVSGWERAGGEVSAAAAAPTEGGES